MVAGGYCRRPSAAAVPAGGQHQRKHEHPPAFLLQNGQHVPESADDGVECRDRPSRLRLSAGRRHDRWESPDERARARRSVVVPAIHHGQYALVARHAEQYATAAQCPASTCAQSPADGKRNFFGRLQRLVKVNTDSKCFCGSGAQERSKRFRQPELNGNMYAVR